MHNALITTNRFYIRQLEDKDAHGILLLDGNANVHTYLGNKPIRTLKEAEQTVAFIKNQYIEFGIGRWAVIDKLTDDFVGWTGFKYITNDVNGHINFYDFGYRLREEYWGAGIATETGLACLAYAAKQLKLNDIFAICDISNAGSKNVLLKCGFSIENTFDYENTPHYWFSRPPAMLLENN